LQKANELIDAAFHEKSEIFEWIHKRKDGTEFPAEILLSPVELGGKQVAHAVIRDITERKKAEKVLSESEEKYRTFFENSTDAMLMLRGEKFFDCNAATVEMLGFAKKDEILNMKPWELSPEYQPDGRESGKKAHEMMNIAYDSGSNRFEWIHLRKDGSRIPVEVSLSSIPFHGEVVLLVVWRDISIRKEAELALQDNERKLLAIFDHHFQLTGLIDTDGRLMAANQTALKFAGIEESDVIGQYFWDGPWWTSSQKQEVQDNFERAVKGEFIRFETSHPNVDGEIRNIDFSFNPVRDSEGNIIYIVPEGRDITEIRLAEVALRENVARLYNLSDNLPGGMTYQLDMGKEGQMRKFVYVSAGVEKLHEINAEDVLRDSGLLYGQIVEEDAVKIAEQESQAMESMSPFITEARFKLPSGVIRWSLLSSAPRKSSDGHLIWDGIEMDITKRKETELELEEYRNHLEEMVNKRTDELETTLKNLKKAQVKLVQSEKMASLGILTAGVAHEINNPLNYIMGAFVGLNNYFKEKGTNDEQKTSILLNAIKTGIERTSDIVNGLNQFSRDNSRFDEECDIHSILDNCLVMLNTQIKNKAVINKNYYSKRIIVKGNVGKLHQVFLNIFTNAIQSINKKGEISIFTKTDNKTALIEISDNGSGIDKKDISKITDPFFTTKPPGKGTGLGLSITFSIIQEHKGTLNIESEINKGTRVSIKFPGRNKHD